MQNYVIETPDHVIIQIDPIEESKSETNISSHNHPPMKKLYRCKTIEKPTLHTIKKRSQKLLYPSTTHYAKISESRYNHMCIDDDIPKQHNIA